MIKKDLLKNAKMKKGIKEIFWWTTGISFLLFLIFGYFFLQYVTEGLPSLEQLENPKPILASNVYSADGVLIGQYFRENRVNIDIDSIPPYIIDALISTEDRDFYNHWGVDVQRFIKAMVKTIFLGKKEGASTITQQLSKNLYELKIPDENIFDTIVRKVREWITAVQIEKTYTKREIIEMYLNVSYFGRGAYGISMASKIYFNKKATQITIPEAAVLVAVLKSSVYYDPFQKYNNSLQRRNIVLYNMYDNDCLEEKAFERYKEMPITLSAESAEIGFRSKEAPHFVEHVRRQLSDLSAKYGFNLYEDGLTIYTTLDSRMQKLANRAVKEHLDEYQPLFDKFWKWKDYPKLLSELLDKAIKERPEYRKAKTQQEKKNVYNRLRGNIALIDSVEKVAQTIEVGFVAMDVRTGEIKAMVGGRNFNFAYGLNHVTQIKRQPGSSFKPIIYTVAIDNGLYPAYPILNQPFDFNGWSPHNFDMSTSGYMMLRDALRRSENIVAAKLVVENHAPLWQIGKYAQNLGIKSKLALYPAISLGAAEVTPLEMVNAFGTLANKGIHNEPFAITRIEDKDGILIANFKPESSEGVSEETAYIITDMLTSVIDHGTGLRARSYFGRPAAGKTGTTQEFGDAWFIGYTPQLVAGAWVGFDDRRISFTGNYGQGSKAALPIWGRFMKFVYDSIEMPIEYFKMPENGNVVSVQFCKSSITEDGDPRLYSSDCSDGALTDIIKLKDVPKSYDRKERNTGSSNHNPSSHEALEYNDEDDDYGGY